MIDTLYSIKRLDGLIIDWYTVDSAYAVEGGGMTCGDGIDAFMLIGRPIMTRAFLSFDLSQIQRDTNKFKLANATIGLYQLESIGDGNQGVFPIFNNQPGRFPCILDHVDYGDTLDWWDWTVGDLGDSGTIHDNIGIISNSPTIGFKQSNVTPHVQEDLTNGRRYNQYRIRFKVGHDDDSLTDHLAFAPPGFLSNIHTPYLILEWKDTQTRVAESTDLTHSISFDAFPNPFNPTTTIRFTVPHSSFVTVKVFNIHGEEVATLASEELLAGTYTRRWNAVANASGVYFCLLNAMGIVRTQKLVLIH